MCVISDSQCTLSVYPSSYAIWVIDNLVSTMMITFMPYHSRRMWDCNVTNAAMYKEKTVHMAESFYWEGSDYIYCTVTKCMLTDKLTDKECIGSGLKTKLLLGYIFGCLESACPTYGTLQFTRNHYWLVHDNSLDLLPSVHYGVDWQKVCVCVLWTHQLVWFLHTALQNCGMSNDDCLPLCWKGLVRFLMHESSWGAVAGSGW